MERRTRTKEFIKTTGTGSEDDPYIVVNADYYFELGEGTLARKGFLHKFGRNKQIDVASGFETIWNGGGFYTGFNATAAETVEVLSSGANGALDTGALVTSGTATGGTITTLEDTGAAFIGSVNIGDCIINDTQAFHGVVTAVISDTVLRVFRFDKTPHTVDGQVLPVEGDTYRIATNASTGVSVIKLENLLDGDLLEQTPEYVIMNGLTAVDTVNAHKRCSRGRCIIAGSGGVNAGEIIVRQKVTPANVFCVLPLGANHTTIAAYTIPANKEGHITGYFAGLSGKVQANCNVRVRTRHPGEIFVVREEFSISGSGTSYIIREYKVPKNDLSPGVDILIDADTDTNGTGVAAGFDLVTIEEL